MKTINDLGEIYILGNKINSRLSNPISIEEEIELTKEIIYLLGLIGNDKEIEIRRNYLNKIQKIQNEKNEFYKEVDYFQLYDKAFDEIKNRIKLFEVFDENFKFKNNLSISLNNESVFRQGIMLSLSTYIYDIECSNIENYILYSIKNGLDIYLIKKIEKNLPFISNIDEILNIFFRELYIFLKIRKSYKIGNSVLNTKDGDIIISSAFNKKDVEELNSELVEK